jgi:hypothetical protein
MVRTNSVHGGNLTYKIFPDIVCQMGDTNDFDSYRLMVTQPDTTMNISEAT